MKLLKGIYYRLKYLDSHLNAKDGNILNYALRVRVSWYIRSVKWSGWWLLAALGIAMISIFKGHSKRTSKTYQRYILIIWYTNLVNKFISYSSVQLLSWNSQSAEMELTVWMIMMEVLVVITRMGTFITYCLAQQKLNLSRYMMMLWKNRNA